MDDSVRICQHTESGTSVNITGTNRISNSGAQYRININVLRISRSITLIRHLPSPHNSILECDMICGNIGISDSYIVQERTVVRYTCRNASVRGIRVNRSVNIPAKGCICRCSESRCNRIIYIIGERPNVTMETSAVVIQPRIGDMPVAAVEDAVNRLFDRGDNCVALVCHHWRFRMDHVRNTLYGDGAVGRHLEIFRHNMISEVPRVGHAVDDVMVVVNGVAAAVREGGGGGIVHEGDGRVANHYGRRYGRVNFTYTEYVAEAVGNGIK